MFVYSDTALSRMKTFQAEGGKELDFPFENV